MKWKQKHIKQKHKFNAITTFIGNYSLIKYLIKNHRITITHCHHTGSGPSQSKDYERSQTCCNYFLSLLLLITSIKILLVLLMLIFNVNININSFVNNNININILNYIPGTHVTSGWQYSKIPCCVSVHRNPVCMFCWARIFLDGSSTLSVLPESRWRIGVGLKT